MFKQFIRKFSANKGISLERYVKDHSKMVDNQMNMYNRVLIVACAGVGYMFNQMDKRFNQMDKRFEQVDKRFEQVDKRFEHVEQSIAEIKQSNAEIKQLIAQMTASK